MNFACTDSICSLMTRFVDFPTIMFYLDFKDKAVIMYGSGLGWFSNKLIMADAFIFTGVDKNFDLIKKCLASSLYVKKMRFICADARIMKPIGLHDIAIVYYVFDHCSTKEEVYAVAQTIGENLIEKGRCLVLTRNIFPTFFWGKSLKKYGVTFKKQEPRGDDGYSVIVKWSDIDGCSHSGRRYVHTEAVFRTAFRLAGFKEIEFKLIQVDTKMTDELLGQSFWNDLVDNPHQMVILAEKK